MKYICYGYLRRVMRSWQQFFLYGRHFHGLGEIETWLRIFFLETVSKR